MTYYVYGTPACGFCKQALAILDRHDEDYVYQLITNLSSEQQQDLMTKAGVQFKTVPQVFLDDEYIGGFTQLKEKLDEK